MPHSNGRIYTEPNVDSTKPDWGVDLTGDIAAVLGVNSGDLGTLCQSDRINKWARWKPVSLQNLAQPSYTQLVNNLHFGLNILHYYGKMSGFGNEVAEYAKFEFGGTTTGRYAGWKDGVKYVKPSSYFRQTDFVCKEKPHLFGYYQNAQLLWNQPGTTHAIGSAIGDGAEIDLAEVEDYQDLPNDSAVFSETNINVDISQQTNIAYNSLSVPEIIKSYGYNGTGHRGLVLTDGYGGVAYTCFDSIPWGQWKVNVQEAVLFGDWHYLEFYTDAASEEGNGNYYLIPGLMGSCHITTGSGSQGGIQFQPSPDNGIVTYNQTLQKYVSHVEFARVDGQQVSEWNLEVIVRKFYQDETTSTPYYDENISNIPSYTSGNTWYNFDFGIDLGTTDNYGDTFELVIQGTRKNVSESTRVVHRSRFVLTQ